MDLEKYMNLYGNTIDLESVDLERAVEILDEFGWVQGLEGNKLMGFCAVGAIRYAKRERLNRSSSLHRSLVAVDLDALNMATETEWYSMRVPSKGGYTFTADGLPAYNDTEGRTKEEVQDLLTKGAKRLRDLGR